MNDLQEMLGRIAEKKTDQDGRIFALRMRTKDVVTVTGSVLGGWLHMPKEKEEAAILATRLLDAGTKRTGKDTLRARIEDRGATLSFSIGTDRTFFDISCLPEDLSRMLETVAECLSEPLFDSAELERSRHRLESSIKNAAHNTDKQARIGLARAIYAPSHPSYADSDAERLRNIAKVRVADLRTFHRSIGRAGLVLSIVGDIKAQEAIAHAERAFSKLPAGTLSSIEYPRNTKEPRSFEQKIQIADKSNIDVYMGVSLPFRYGEPLHRPTQLFAAMLGDGVTAHLMNTVRERDGLTYGIYAGLHALTTHRDGHFAITASFAPELYDRGVSAALSETKKFIDRGITEAAVEARKEEMAGAYLVGMTTTSSIADTLHTIGVRGQGIEQIAAFPEQIKAVTRAQVKDAAAQIPLDKLAIVAAGTFKK